MRERDIRNAIRDALVATDAFDAVWLGAPTEGTSAFDRLAIIDPVGAGIASSAHHAGAIAETGRLGTGLGWDDRADSLLDYTGTAKLTLIARDEDPQIRDEMAEQLLAVLCNAVNGQVLVPGFTIPAKTIVAHWTWKDASPPERQIEATVSYGFLVPWNAWDVSD